jgi:hypothetical protein
MYGYTEVRSTSPTDKNSKQNAGLRKLRHQLEEQETNNAELDYGRR